MPEFDLKTPTWLPIFPGFYETAFKPECILVCPEMFELGEYPEDFEFDNPKYKDDVAKTACQAIEKFIKEYLFPCKIEYEKVDSPREYNYRNDSIDIVFSCDSEDFIRAIRYNYKDVKDAIANEYKSRSGYIPACPSNVEDYLEFWGDGVKSALRDSHKCGFLLDTLLRLKYKENDIEIALFYEVQETIPGYFETYASHYWDENEKKWIKREE
ncbi:MAG: hypothetical protein ACP6IQ_01900 [Candidatus Njordarchaeia archaeon]